MKIKNYLAILIAVLITGALVNEAYANRGSEDPTSEKDENKKEDPKKEGKSCKNCQKNSGSTKNSTNSNSNSGCDCPKKTGTADKTTCIQFDLPFGKPLYASGIEEPSIFFRKEAPTPTLYSPQALRYSLNIDSNIWKVVTEDLDPGIAREVHLVRPNGFAVVYQFLDGESVGNAIGDQSKFLSVLQMTDADGNPVTSDPVYYRRIFSNDSYVTFSASSLWAISVTGAHGVTTTRDDPGLGIEIIKDGYFLRQILSKTDGLADIVVVNDYKYEIRLYNHSDVGTKDAEGRYTVSGSPRMVWSFENPNQSDTDISKVRMTQTVNSNSYVYDWEYIESSNTWKVVSAGGLKVTTQTKLWNGTKTEMTETHIIKDASNNVVSHKLTRFKKYPFGLYKDYIVIDPDGVALTTTYAYYEDAGETNRYGRMKSVLFPDGSWESYDYDAKGRMSVKILPFKDSPFGSAANQAKAIYFSYNSHDALDIPTENDDRPRTIETKILDITVSKTYYAFITSANGEFTKITENCADVSKPYGDSTNLRVTRTHYAPSVGNPA